MNNLKDNITMLYSVNYGEYSPDVTVSEILYEQAKQNPNNIALVFEGRQITYGELNIKSNQLARVLRRKGVKPNDFVALLTTHSIEMIIAIYAVIKAGGAYVPINNEDAILRQTFILNNSEAKILLTNLDNFSLEATTEIIFLTEEIYKEEKCDNLDNVNTPSDLLYLLYTSGTTGKPKGVMIEHRNMISFILSSNEYCNLCSSDTFIMIHTYCFDVSALELYGAAFSAAKLIIVSRDTARDLISLMNIIREEKVTVTWFVTSVFYSLSELDFNTDDINLRIVFVGGEKVNPLRMRSFHKKLPKVKLYNAYGPTETTVFSTCKELSDEDMEIEVSNIGTSISSTYCYVMNGLELCSKGESGELCIGGVGVARGYWKEDDLTSKKFINNPFYEGEKIYRTGDLVRLLPNGDIEFIGRVDNQVKIRGYRIELEEIENRIRQFPGVKNTVVKTYNENTQLVGYISFSHNKANSEHRFDKLINYLSDCVPKYMIPTIWVEMDEIPLLNTGKTNRNNLPEPILSSELLETQFNDMKDPIQQGVINIMSEILHITQINIRDSFFNMGGHSLLITKLQIKIKEKFEILIPIIFFYNNPSVEQIVNYIKNFEESTKNIQKKDDLINEIGNILNLMENEYFIHQDESGYLLFIDEIKLQKSKEDYTLLLKNNISKRMPLYIFPSSFYKEEYYLQKNEYDTEKIAERIIKDNYKSGDIYGIIKNLYKGLDDYTYVILANKVVKKYEVSPSQLLSLDLGCTISHAQIEFNEGIDIDKMEKAWTTFVRNNGLLKSSITLSDVENSIIEFECNKIVKLPFVDITYYSDEMKNNVLDSILYVCNEYKSRKYYNSNHLTNRIVLVKMNESNYRLIIICTHLIFDGFSSEFFVSTIRDLYNKEESAHKVQKTKGNYKEYIDFVKAGPKDTSENEIMDVMNLSQFKNCLGEYQHYAKSMELNIINYSYSLDPNDNITEEIGILIAGKIFKLALKLAFHNRKVPVFFYYSGRIYNDACFTNYMGEFIDLIPHVVDTCTDDNIIEKINSQLEFIRKHNVNIASIKYDNNIKLQYPKIANVLQSNDIMDIPIFNYIGLFKSANESEKYWTNNAKLESQISYTEKKVMAKLICPKGKEEELRNLLDSSIQSINLNTIII